MTRVLVEHLKQFAVRYNSPGRPSRACFPGTSLLPGGMRCWFCLSWQLRVFVCRLHSSAPTQADLLPPLFWKTDCRKDIANDAEWLDINLGLFSTVANYSDLKELNISGVNHLLLLCFSSHTALREFLAGSDFWLFICFLFFFFFFSSCLWEESKSPTVMRYLLCVWVLFTLAGSFGIPVTWPESRAAVGSIHRCSWKCDRGEGGVEQHPKSPRWGAAREILWNVCGGQQGGESFYNVFLFFFSQCNLSIIA